MSFKLLKSQEDCAYIDNSFFPDITRIQQRRLWKTWSLDLSRLIRLKYVDNSYNIYRRDFNRRPELIEKKIMRKYYGKKVLYVTWPQETAAMIFRSKFLSCVKIQEDSICQNNLKSKGNSVILGNNVSFRKKCLIKRIFKYCQKAHFDNWVNISHRFLPCMIGLKYLSMRCTKSLKPFWLGKSIRNLLSLEAIRVDFSNSSSLNSYYVPRNNYLRIYSFSKGFFSQLHSLFHLKKVKFISNDAAFFYNEDLKKDLEGFYNKPLKFDLLIRILCYRGLPIENNENLTKILRTAEYLCVGDFLSFESQIEMSKAVEKRLRFRKQNIVEIFLRHFDDKINLFQILSCCESLESLLLKERSSEFYWERTDGMDEEIKGFKSLKDIVLDFESFRQINISQESFSSPLLKILSEIKTNCLCLQNLSMYFTILDFPSFTWAPNSSLNDPGAFVKNFEKIMKEITTFDKVKAFGLWTIPEDLKLVFPERILSANHLEAFQLRLCKRFDRIECPDWDDLFAKVVSSGIKELIIRTNEQTKVSLYGIKLLNFVRKLENLEVVEFIDEDLEVIKFDFLYDMVFCLLEKKKMKKIFICTRVMADSFSENFGGPLLKSLCKELQSIDWENRVKASQIEEIFVGKLRGYSVDYLFYEKGVDKLFWTEKELKEYLRVKKDVELKYQEKLDLFKKKEDSVW